MVVVGTDLTETELYFVRQASRMVSVYAEDNTQGISVRTAVVTEQGNFMVVGVYRKR